MKRYISLFIVLLCAIPLLALPAYAASTYTAYGTSDGFGYLGTLLPEGNYNVTLYDVDGQEFIIEDVATIVYDSDGFCVIPCNFIIEGIPIQFFVVDFIFEGQSVVGFTDSLDKASGLYEGMYIVFSEVPGAFSLIDAVSDSFYAVLGWFTKLNFELSASGSLHHLWKLFAVGIGISVLLVSLKIIKCFVWS